METQKANELVYALARGNSSYIGKHRDLSFLKEIDGMGTDKFYRFLNDLSFLKEQGEDYVEVGSYRGKSLISSAFENHGTHIGIENFSEFDSSLDGYNEMWGNIRKFSNENVTFINDDFRNVKLDNRVGLFYLDAKHDYETTLSGLEWIIPNLSKRCVIVLDDFNMIEVDRAIYDFLYNHKDFRIMFSLKTLHNFYEVEHGKFSTDWYDGICVLFR